MKKWHWVLTLQWANSTGGNATITEGGVITDPPGTRAETLVNLMNAARVKHNAPEGVSVLFFSLEPNDLTEA